MRRGTLQVHLRCERQYSAQDFRVNTTALRSYINQLRNVCDELGLRERGEVLLAQVLALPGVVAEPGRSSDDGACPRPRPGAACYTLIECRAVFMCVSFTASSPQISGVLLLVSQPRCPNE